MLCSSTDLLHKDPCVSYPFYKIMHFVGIFVMLVALAATCMHAAMGGTKAENPFRRALGAAHGVLRR